jgi:excisionase family DNA binding protein
MMAATKPPQDAPAPAAAPLSPLLDATEAGRLLSVPASWVLAEARANRIPHVRLGRYVRFSADDLEEWWRARMRGAVAYTRCGLAYGARCLSIDRQSTGGVLTNETAIALKQPRRPLPWAADGGARSRRR